MSLPAARDVARKRFSDAGLTYDVLTDRSLARLRRILDEEMRGSGSGKSGYRTAGRTVIRTDASGTTAWIRCRSDTFDDREAVTFGPKGFIGFAGWADDVNVVPVLDGFARWVDEMRAACLEPDGTSVDATR